MTSTATPRPFTGRHMLFTMLGFFAVVFAANMTMVYFAASSWTGLVVKNSYVASQEFDTTTAKLEAAAALDIHPTVDFANGKLTVTLRTKAGEAVGAANVSVTLGRPSHEGEDRTVAMTAAGNGAYEAADQRATGQWTGTVSAEVSGFGTWTRPIRLLVKG